jgi:hypothetical protein
MSCGEGISLVELGVIFIALCMHWCMQDTFRAGRMSKALPDGMPMIQVYDQFNKTLLLLGAPEFGWQNIPMKARFC